MQTVDHAQVGGAGGDVHLVHTGRDLRLGAPDLRNVIAPVRRGGAAELLDVDRQIRIAQLTAEIIEDLFRRLDEAVDRDARAVRAKGKGIVLTLRPDDPVQLAGCLHLADHLGEQRAGLVGVEIPVVTPRAVKRCCALLGGNPAFGGVDHPDIANRRVLLQLALEHFIALP